MQLPSDVPFELLDRYFTGRCTPDEVDQVRDAFATDPELAALRRVVIGAHVDVEAAWKRFSQSPWMQDSLDDARPLFLETEYSDSLRAETQTYAVRRTLAMQRVGEGTPDNAVLPRKRVVWRGWLSHIVTLACAVALAFVGWNAGTRHLARRASSSMMTYTTGNAERANITLPDGNTVSLNVTSRLEVPADYIAGDHIVHLAGEGVFTITHHNGAPFTVMTSAGAANVLGTTFLVRHYATDTTTLVAVRDGKVSMRSEVLMAGRQVEFSNTGVARFQVVDPARFSFAAGVLAVNGTLLRDAIPDLNRWYDADIRMGDSVVAMRRITGGFTAGSLADLTELLELTFDMRVVRDGRVITIYQR